MQNSPVRWKRPWVEPLWPKQGGLKRPQARVEGATGPKRKSQPHHCKGSHPGPVQELKEEDGGSIF